MTLSYLDSVWCCWWCQISDGTNANQPVLFLHAVFLPYSSKSRVTVECKVVFLHHLYLIDIIFLNINWKWNPFLLGWLLFIPPINHSNAIESYKSDSIKFLSLLETLDQDFWGRSPIMVRGSRICQTADTQKVLLVQANRLFTTFLFQIHDF